MTEQKHPQEYGKCRIEKEIGRGAASIVYLAWHESLRIPVAVKVMTKGDNEGMTKRVMREANIAAQLSHPGIVRIYDCGETEDSYYLVLDYIDGDDCQHQIDEKGAYDWPRAVEIIRQVADGLRYAHERGMIHRDLKPQNIMIYANGKACLADLGLAKIISDKMSSETLAGDVLGTPFYMSPEQIKQPRDVDFRSDIYSLGATLYHMVVGGPPFEAPTAYEIMAKHLTVALVFPEEKRGNLPEPLCQLVMRAMAKEPADRYQSYDDLMADLDALLSGEQVADSDVVPAHEPAPDADMAAIRAGIIEEAKKAPLQAPTHVAPDRLGATMANVQAKVAGVLALLVYVLLLACVHQLVLTRAGLAAAVALTAAMLLVI